MRFQVGVNKQTGKEIAMKVVSVRQRVRARVESLKGQVSSVFHVLSDTQQKVSPVNQSADSCLFATKMCVGS